jgi:hypothetical protein
MLVLSGATNEMYVGICGQSAVDFDNPTWITNNVAIRYDEELAVMVFCRTGAVQLLVPLNDAYFIKFEMSDATGKEISKTAEGSRWGSEFDEFSSKPGGKNRVGSWGASGSHLDGFSKFSPGPRLPRPTDLFEIKNPGIYDLTMRIHFMKQRMLTNDWTWDSITIPPVTVKVEKPPDHSK